MTLLGILVAVQFVVLLGLALVVLSLARQVGILHKRLAQVGTNRARKGLAPGATLPELALTALSGSPVDLSRGKSALLFLSADCPVCRSVLPAFESSLAGSGLTGYRVADGLPGPDGGLPDYAAYARERDLDPDRFLVSQELGLVLGVRQLPTLVLLDEGRLVRRETVGEPAAVKRLLAAAALSQPATPGGDSSRPARLS